MAALQAPQARWLPLAGLVAVAMILLIAASLQRGEPTQWYKVGITQQADATPCAEGQLANEYAVEPTVQAWQVAAARNLSAYTTRLLSGSLGGFGNFHKYEWHRPMFAPVITCPPYRPLTRYGGGPEVDGSKVLCELEPALGAAAQSKAGGKPCVIYSLGSNGQWQFEEAMLNHTACDIVTLDCTYNGHSLQPGRHSYHKWCVGDPARNATLYRSWANITQSLGHSRVDFLKMDVEGHEYPILAELQPGMALPQEISMELHAWDVRFPRGELPRSAGGMALVFGHLARLGYATYSMEINPLGPHCCAEFSMLRVADQPAMQPAAMARRLSRL